MSQDQDTVIALFNYGGGLRGLIPAHIMARIEDMTDLRMAEMVDIFCGPSTGAILNAALTLPHPDEPDTPKYRARHMVRFYEQDALKIFPPDRFRSFRGLIHDFNNRTMRLGQLNNIFRHGHYDPKNLGRSLRALYGDAKLSGSLRSLIIPVYNIDGEQLAVVREEGETADTPVHTKNNVTDAGGHALWLKNIRINHPPGAPLRTPDVSLFDAVMASCAAPTYFPCHHFNVTWPDTRGTHEYAAIDGSIFDNPGISYLGALRRHVKSDQKLVMIGLGTGTTNRSIKKEDWNRYGSLGVVDPVNDLPLINIFFHASETALMESFAEEMEGNLHIFNKSLVNGRQGEWPSPQIDDGSPENLERLRNFAEILMEEHKSQLDTVCDLLVRNRDKMSQKKAVAAKSAARRIFGLFRRGQSTASD